jgi:hypothetical protein
MGRGHVSGARVGEDAGNALADPAVAEVEVEAGINEYRTAGTTRKP